MNKRKKESKHFCIDRRRKSRCLRSRKFSYALKLQLTLTGGNGRRCVSWPVKSGRRGQGENEAGDTANADLFHWVASLEIFASPMSYSLGDNWSSPLRLTNELCSCLLLGSNPRFQPPPKSKLGPPPSALNTTRKHQDRLDLNPPARMFYVG